MIMQDSLELTCRICRVCRRQQCLLITKTGVTKKNVQMSWSRVMGYELVVNSVFPLFVGLTWLSGENGLSSKV